jgi:hypothetical protein
MKDLLVFGIFTTTIALASQSFSFSYGGRTYTVTTQALGVALPGWDTSYWLYEPSVILPSPLTNNQYVMIFTSGTGYFSQQGIFISTSSSPTSFPSPPTQVLNLGAVYNVCDIIDARPYWDGAMWHVYVQGLETCPGGTSAWMYEATGPSLTQLSWVTDSPNHAQRIISPYDPSNPSGIGEVLQWFNTSAYLGPPSWPYVTTFNDWSYYGQDCQPFNPNGSYNCYDYCPSCAFNGTDFFSYLGADGTSPLYFWYYRQSPSVNVSGTYATFWPDVILGASLDGASAGNPGLAFADYPDPDGSHQDGAALGFFPDLIPYAPSGNRNPSGGVYIPGNLESTTMAGSAPRAHTPRIARNAFGYLDPVPGSSPLTWQTYVYYNDGPIKGWGARFAVSSLTITQQ